MIALVGLLLAAEVELPGARQVSDDRPGHCEQPRWSRNGRHLAYHRWRGGSMEQDVLWDLKREVRLLPSGFRPPEPGGEATDVWDEVGTGGAPGANPGQTCRQLAWGPIAQPDAFVYTCNVDQGYRLFSQTGDPIDGAPGEAAQPAWNPDRDEIAFVGAGGVFRLACRRLGRSCGWGKNRPEAMVRGAGAEWAAPLWAGGGRLVVERHPSPRQGDLWLVDPAAPRDAVLQQLTDVPGVARAPALSPDGKKVAWFLRPPREEGAEDKSGGRQQIWVQSLEPGAKPLRVAEDAVLSESGPAFTPDGRHLIYVRDHAEAADPLVAVRLPDRPTAKPRRRVLRTNTLVNRGPAVSADGDRWSLAVSAVGALGDDLRRSWRKIYVLSLDPLKRPD